ncbi:MAG: hypothetical protein AAB479_02395 [Patescibacteria group bacterium]
MSSEKPQFEAFWKGEQSKSAGKKKEKDSAQREIEEREQQEREEAELKVKSIELAKGVQEAFANNDLGQALEKLQQLEKLASPEARLDFREAREILEKDFIGPEAVEKTWGIKLTPEEASQIENIPFSREELEQAKALGMMLVLRVPHDKEGKPLSIDRMREVMQGEDKLGDPTKKKNKIFYYKKGEAWHDKEKFSLEDTTKLGWGLAAKAVLPESLSKNWDQQEEVLKEWAKKNGIDPNSVRRRTPTEVVYDTITYYGANKESLLERTWDWSAVQSSDGSFVCAGGFDSGGLHVDYDSRGNSDSTLGVCPAR